MLQQVEERNLVFLGDMNWGAIGDGEPPLPPGWYLPFLPLSTSFSKPGQRKEVQPAMSRPAAWLVCCHKP